MTSEPIGSWRLLTALCIAASTTMQGASPVLACQVRPAATETVDATAGIYQADNPGLSGPMFRVRYRASITSALKGGVYLQYRDDTPVGGRAQTVGLGAELLLAHTQLSGDILYVLLGGSLDEAMAADRDLPVGLHPYGSVGIGAVGLIGPFRAVLEARLQYGAGGLFKEVSIGAVTSSREHLGNGGEFMVFTSTFARANELYRQENRFRGYNVAYQYPLNRRISLRGSLGISFLRFLSRGLVWSTGAISLTLGAPVTVFEVGGHPLAIRMRVLPEAGAWLFSEPRSQAYPLTAIGTELGVTVGGVGFVVGGNAVLANGPAGRLTGLQPRIGVSLAF
jgi:hypothetical protein